MMTRLIAFTVLIMVAPLAGASHEENEGSDVIWRLGSEGTALRTMFREPHPGIFGDGNTTIPAGSSAIWLADEVAAVNVEFQNGDDFFIVNLQVRRGTAMQISLGIWDPAGPVFTPCAAAINHQFGAALGPATPFWAVEAERAISISFAFTPASCLVPQGDLLALRLSAVNGDLKLGTLPLTKPYTDPALTQTLPPSRVIYSGAPPTYPVPELPTLIMAFLGLALVARVAPRITGRNRTR